MCSPFYLLLLYFVTLVLTQADLQCILVWTISCHIFQKAELDQHRPNCLSRHWICLQPIRPMTEEKKKWDASQLGARFQSALVTMQFSTANQLWVWETHPRLRGKADQYVWTPGYIFIILVYYLFALCVMCVVNSCFSQMCCIHKVTWPDLPPPATFQFTQLSCWQPRL